MCIVFLFVTVLFADQSQQLPSDMTTLALQSITCVWNEQFKQAEQVSKQLIKKYPDHPIGYFCYAGIINAYVEYSESTKWETEFYQYCDLTIEKAEQLRLQKKSDVWLAFFVAAANGFKGKYEGKFERWVTAFKHGWSSYVILEQIVKEHTGMHDAYYGIGTYMYWRSAKTKIVWWMPGVGDKRSDGLLLLRKACDNGIYAKQSACMELSAALFNEQKYEGALSLVDTLLLQYPENTLCLFSKAKICIELKRYEEAVSLLKAAQIKFQKFKFDCSYTNALCHFLLITAYFRLQAYGECIGEYNTLVAVKLDDFNQKRIEKYKQEASKLVQKSRSLVSLKP